MGQFYLLYVQIGKLLLSPRALLKCAGKRTADETINCCQFNTDDCVEMSDLYLRIAYI